MSVLRATSLGIFFSPSLCATSGACTQNYIYIFISVWLFLSSPRSVPTPRSPDTEIKTSRSPWRILANVPRGRRAAFPIRGLTRPLDFRLSSERIPGRIHGRSTNRADRATDIKEYPGSAIPPLTCPKRQREVDWCEVERAEWPNRRDSDAKSSVRPSRRMLSSRLPSRRFASRNSRKI